MKIKLLLVIVCWMAFGLGAYAQRLNNSYSRDTVLKDGNIIVSENIRTELIKIPLPTGVDARFYKKIVTAVQHQKEIAISTLQMNLFFQLENQIRLYRYDNKHKVWNPLMQTRHEKSNLIMYVMILLIVGTFFVGWRSSRSEFWGIFVFSLIVWIMLSILFMILHLYITNTNEVITEYKRPLGQWILSIIEFAFLSSLAILGGRVLSRKKETEESLMIGIG